MTAIFEASVTPRQRQWFMDALAAIVLPIPHDVTVRTVAEPSAPGHKDYMAATVEGDVNVIEIRAGADDPDAAFNTQVSGDLQHFYMESVIHEMVHVATFRKITTDADKTEVAGWFHQMPDTGAGLASGVLADWNPLDRPWADRIQEGVAEVVKDAVLPESMRAFDNRSSWELSRARYTDLLNRLGLLAGEHPVAPYGPVMFEGRSFYEALNYEAGTRGMPPTPIPDELNGTTTADWNTAPPPWPIIQKNSGTDGIAFGGMGSYDHYRSIVVNGWWANDHAPDGLILLVLDFTAIPGWTSGAPLRRDPITGNYTNLGSGLPATDPGQASVGIGEVYVQINDNYDAPYNNVQLLRNYSPYTGWTNDPYGPDLVVAQDWPWGDGAVKIVPLEFELPVRGGHMFIGNVDLFSATTDTTAIGVHIMFPEMGGKEPPWPYGEASISGRPSATAAMRLGR